jgi:hypothetical protein
MARQTTGRRQKRYYYVLTVTYGLSLAFRFDDHLQDILGECSGSGGGLGGRDMDWDYDRKADIDAAERKLAPLLAQYPGVFAVNQYRYPEEREWLSPLRAKSTDPPGGERMKYPTAVLGSVRKRK